MTYTQDLAAPLPVVLQARAGNTTTLYLFDMGTRPLAEYDSAWEYLLPDGLGSVRQLVDASGNVKLTESYEPYGSVLSSQGSATSAFGFTGEQTDSYTQLVFLRARWYHPEISRWISPDDIVPDFTNPQSLNLWSYVEGNPINRIDPSGHISEGEKFYIRTLYNWYIRDTASRLNVHSLTNLSNDAFSAMIAAKILAEDATIYSDRLWDGLWREVSTIPPSFLRDWARNCAEDWVFGGEISWGPANIPLPLAIQNLEWWEQNYQRLGLNFEDVHTYYSTFAALWPLNSTQTPACGLSCDPAGVECRTAEVAIHAHPSVHWSS